MGMMKFKKFIAILFLFLLIVPAGGCASSRDQSLAYKSPTDISDPLEPINRVVFSFNNTVDTVFFEPVAKLYRFILPEFARDSIRNFTRNLQSPLTFAHNILQGEFSDAGVSLGRFLMNTTVGVAGLFDVAAKQGLEYEREDWGQTLGKWGLGHGFYVVLPIVGPSSLRDGIGLVGDSLSSPVFWYAYNDANREWVYYLPTALEKLDERARLIEAISDLRNNSVDYYAAVRSIYGQKRYSLVLDDPYAGLDFEYDEYDN